MPIGDTRSLLSDQVAPGIADCGRLARARDGTRSASRRCPGLVGDAEGVRPVLLHRYQSAGAWTATCRRARDYIQRLELASVLVPAVAIAAAAFAFELVGVVLRARSRAAIE